MNERLRLNRYNDTKEKREGVSCKMTGFMYDIAYFGGIKKSWI